MKKYVAFEHKDVQARWKSINSSLVAKKIDVMESPRKDLELVMGSSYIILQVVLLTRRKMWGYRIYGGFDVFLLSKPICIFQL
jgi:hypothetical protein